LDFVPPLVHNGMKLQCVNEDDSEWEIDFGIHQLPALFWERTPVKLMKKTNLGTKGI